MSKKMVMFRSPDDVLDFVKKVEKYPYDMDMKRGRYIVDAKSLLGLMNLGFEQEIELKVYNDDCDDLWKDIEKYVAA
ncbi:MAG: HPr family phosphocarrier protein [Dorea sp.]